MPTTSVEKNRIYVARYRAKNIEKSRARVNAWYAANREKVLAATTAWGLANPEKVKKAQAKWWRANKEKVYSANAKRRAMSSRATPAWANHFFIEEAYDLAQLRTKATGFKWEVDHIVPLRSKRVCGFHVENNLRVIPAISNHLKSNRHWPDMP